MKLARLDGLNGTDALNISQHISRLVNNDMALEGALHQFYELNQVDEYTQTIKDLIQVYRPNLDLATIRKSVVSAFQSSETPNDVLENTLQTALADPNKKEYSWWYYGIAVTGLAYLINKMRQSKNEE